MRARRAVKAGLAADDDAAVAAARTAVHDAKIALGERGEPWWDEPSAEGLRDRSAATCRTLLRARAPESTICPSDVARVVGGGRWRDQMDLVRTIVAGLATDGVVVVRQKGEVVAVDASGPIRIGRGPAFAPGP